MRFRFFQPTNEAETGMHLGLLARMDEFWRTGERLLPRTERAPVDVPRVEAALNEAVMRLDPGLLVELGGEPERMTAVIAPKDDRGLDPMIEELIRRAPRLGADLYRHWPAAPVDRVLADAKTRFSLDLSDCQLRAGFGRGHLMEVVVYSSEFGAATDDAGLDAANFVVSRVLGDRAFDDWVGSVEISPVPRASSLRVLSAERSAAQRFGIAELQSVFSGAIENLKLGLPSAPYHQFCERGEWTLLELEPAMASDYSSLDDLALCATLVPEMTKSYLQGSPFSSERFSTTGETFCYLKVDGAGASDEERFDARLALEEALNRALVPGGVGCVVGAGLGLRYVYLVLALARLEAGIEIARRVARREEVAERAWLLFCDTALRHEWVGVWDDTPAPP